MAVPSVSSLAEEIQNILISDSPDVISLQTHLEKELKLSPLEAEDLIYEAVLRLNSKLLPPITKLELILTEGCNLACSYCFEKNMLGYKKMPLEIAHDAIDLLFDYSGSQRELHITHFGGEPTLNFPAIKYATEYAEQEASLHGKTVKFDITSNGVLLDETMVDYFAKHEIMVLLSVDGLAPTHDRYRLDKFGRGTFEKVMNGLQILKQKQSYVGVKMTVMPGNVPNLFRDVMGLRDLGVNHFIIGHATGVKWTDSDIQGFAEQWGKLYDWYKENRGNDLLIDGFDDVNDTSWFGCQAGKDSICVTIDGQISPCAKILGLNNKQLLAKLGDIRYGLTHISNRFELVSCSKIRSYAESQNMAQDYQGGCFAANYEDNHDIFQPSEQEHVISLRKKFACSGCK